MTFLFASAVDSSCPRLADGTHADAMDRGGHYARWEEDLELAATLGLRALRYGPAYYRTHLAPERFDWEPSDAPFARMRALRLQPIACLCDGGMPSWIAGAHDVAFPVLFAEYARAFARRYPWIRMYVPIRDVAGFARREATHPDGTVDERRFAKDAMCILTSGDGFIVNPHVLETHHQIAAGVLQHLIIFFDRNAHDFGHFSISRIAAFGIFNNTHGLSNFTRLTMH